MDLNDSPSEAEFRLALRRWLEAHKPVAPVPHGAAEKHAFLSAWHRDLHQGGWLGLSWPREYGGRGLGPGEEAILQEELARAAAPDAPTFGYIGRPILLFGSEDQKNRYLPPMLAMEERWCQGFSEPNAGSDLANLRTRAVRDGDRYLVTGHKIWTSYAQFADYCLLLVRTDPDLPKHAGISALAVSMTSPGIRTEPIVTARGDAEFCEVFFDETPVPADNVVGQLGQGWQLAMTTLSYERGPADIGYQARYEVLLGQLVQAVADSGRQDNPRVRERVATAAVAVEVLKRHVQRSLSARARGARPGPEGSIDKRTLEIAVQEVLSAAVDVLGADALLSGGHDWFGDYLYSRAATIYGGTRQIQSDIIAQRLLGLPRG